MYVRKCMHNFIYNKCTHYDTLTIFVLNNYHRFPLAFALNSVVSTIDMCNKIYTIKKIKKYRSI